MICFLVPYSHSVTVESSPLTKTIVSGQSYHLTCTVSLNGQTPTVKEGREAITVQWLNVTTNCNGTSILPVVLSDQVSVGNLTATMEDEFNLSLHLLMARTYHSGEYACRAEFGGIIRQQTVTITVNRTSKHACMHTNSITAHPPSPFDNATYPRPSSIY